MFHVILASASPRRHELLCQAGIAHTVRPADCDESTTAYRLGEPEAYVTALARRKNEACPIAQDEICLSADTVVYLPHTQEILGKPHTRERAAQMLAALSGRTHDVITGVCLRDIHGVFASFAERTAVTFYPLTAHEIDAYVDTARPFDKAGAYGIQELACRYVRSIRGDYCNVVGLPVARVYHALATYTGEEAAFAGV